MVITDIKTLRESVQISGGLGMHAYTTNVSTLANDELRYSFTANQKHNANVLVV